jgi:hypothetical protein
MGHPTVFDENLDVSTKKAFRKGRTKLIVHVFPLFSQTEVHT